MRVERARRLLETASTPTEAVAAQCGFGTVETLRRAFRRRLGVSPGQYRERFRAALRVAAELDPTEEDVMEIAIPLFDRFTALDAVGPYQVLSALPEARVRFSPPRRGRCAATTGCSRWWPRRAGRTRPSPTSSWCPAASAPARCWSDERLLGWVRSVHETSRYTTSVCTGSLVLAAAGILDGVDATTHWMVLRPAAASSAPSPSPSGWWSAAR